MPKMFFKPVQNSSLRSGVEVRHRQPEDVSQNVVVQLASALQRRQVEKQRRDNHCHGLQNNENCKFSLHNILNETPFSRQMRKRLNNVPSFCSFLQT